MVEIRKRDGDLESVSLSIQSNCELHSLWISFFDKALKSERLTGGFWDPLFNTCLPAYAIWKRLTVTICSNIFTTDLVYDAVNVKLRQVIKLLLSNLLRKIYMSSTDVSWYVKP